MGVLRKLASQSAIYGLSSVVPRLLNYFLVVLHSRIFTESEYGVITELYAYVAVLLILLTFGLETGFFRFAGKRENNPPEANRVFGTIFHFLGATSLLFFLLCWIFLTPIAQFLDYSNNPSLLLMMFAILSIDSWSATLFNRLRWEERPIAFSTIKIVSVIVNIGLNLLFLLVFPRLGLYNASFGVGYVLLSNLIGSGVAWLLAFIACHGVPRFFSWRTLTPILAFSFPLLLSGLAGTTNEFMDRIFIKWLSPAADPLSELGIYGANGKIAVLLVLFVQMFKFAAEPFFFSTADEKNDPKIYAIVTKYFWYFTLFILVGILFYIPLLQYFIGSNFRTGIGVIPILLVANLLYGLFFNVSFWYKLQKRTWYGVLFTLTGALVTLIVNLWLTPLLSYYGAAIARVASYAVMCALCILIGHKYFPVPYDYLRFFGSALLAAAIVTLGSILPVNNMIVLTVLRTLLLLLMLLILMRMENYNPRKLLLLWKRRSK